MKTDLTKESYTGLLILRHKVKKLCVDDVERAQKLEAIEREIERRGENGDK